MHADNDSYVIQRGSDIEPACSFEKVRSFIQGLLDHPYNLTTLIGSGASCDAIPLMGDTFREFREELKETDANGSEALEGYIKLLCERDDLGAPEKFSDIEKFLSLLQSRIDGGVDSSEMDSGLFRELKQKFVRGIESCDYSANEKTLQLYQGVVQGLGRSRQILSGRNDSSSDIVNLFTTNYDLFHELALERSRYAYTDGFTNGVENRFSVSEFHRRPIDLEDRFRERFQPVTPFFRLYKLHGSVNWSSRGSNGDGIVRCGHRTPEGESSVIAPMSSKYALTQNAPYSDLFREFVNVMAVPNTILFTSGFGFGDAHISNLIKEALSRTDFMLVAFIGNPKFMDERSGGRRFYESTNSPNAYFIYHEATKKDEDGKEINPGPLLFSEFASFIRPEVITPDEDRPDDSEVSYGR